MQAFNEEHIKKLGSMVDDKTLNEFMALEGTVIMFRALLGMAIVAGEGLMKIACEEDGIGIFVGGPLAPSEVIKHIDKIQTPGPDEDTH